MTTQELAIIFLLISRVPIYTYVIYKALRYRDKMVLISANWLGLMAFAGAVGALTNAFVHEKLITNVAGTIFAFTMFMVGYTAREAKKQ